MIKREPRISAPARAGTAFAAVQEENVQRKKPKKARALPAIGTQQRNELSGPFLLDIVPVSVASSPLFTPHMNKSSSILWTQEACE
jgi:hypothetical protein